MRISDWSSDVCSSDLEGAPARLLAAPSTDYARALAKAAPRMDSPAPDLPPVGEALLEAKGVRVSFRRPGWRGGWFDAVSDAALDIRDRKSTRLNSSH